MLTLPKDWTGSGKWVAEMKRSGQLEKSVKQSSCLFSGQIYSVPE